MIGGMGPDDAPDGSYGGDFGGNVDGGSGRAAAYGRNAEAARGRGRGRNQAYGRDAEAARGVGRRGPGRDTAYGRGAESERGTAQAMAAAYAELQDAFGHNMPGVGYGRGFSRGSKGMPQHQRDSGWRAGQTLTDKYGNPVSLESLSWSRDDLLDDAKYEMWAQQNPDKVRNMPGMLGGLMNSLGLHDLSGAMTPAERGWDDSRWEGGPSDGPQGARFNTPSSEWRLGAGGGSIHDAALRMAQDALRQQMHEKALASEGGDNYDGRYERRNPRAYDEWLAGDAA